MSPRTREAYERIKGARREEILTAARRVFARNGLAATRISDLAAEAHISQGLLYHYFPDKEALFTAIVEGALKDSIGKVEEISPDKKKVKLIVSMFGRPTPMEIDAQSLLAI